MDFTRIFILRPAGTFLLALGLLIVGLIAYHAMPVASMPNVEFPTVRVGASFPGADPETMASTCLLYTSPSPRDRTRSRMPSSA